MIKLPNVAQPDRTGGAGHADHVRKITGSKAPADGELNVFPNPNNGQFILNSGNDETVRIVNELGQLIRAVDLKADAETKVDGLNPGVYFVLSQRTRIKIMVLQ